MDSAEILHFNFATYKINNKWIMQKFCFSTLTLTKSGCKNSAELHFAKFIIKTTSLNLSQNAREG